MYKSFFKRFLDFCIAVVALVLIGWLLVLVIIFLAFANKGAGVFFLQDRPGKDGKLFKVIKFKTVTDERDADGKLLPDAKRLTKVGRFIRSTSIDELPQLINILKGDMSLIGPRPLLPQYVWVFSDFEKRRLEVRPGITGWAQVHGRNHLKLSKKFEYDVWYVDHCTLLTDLKIVLMTVKNVLLREDVGEGAGDMKSVDDVHLSERVKAYKQEMGIQ